MNWMHHDAHHPLSPVINLGHESSPKRERKGRRRRRLITAGVVSVHLFARRKACENGVDEKERLLTRVHWDSIRLLFGMRQPEAAKTPIPLLIALKQVCHCSCAACVS